MTFTRRYWPFVAILVAHALAAAVIFWAGLSVGETRRAPVELDCKPIEWVGRPGLLCFPGQPPVVKAQTGEA